MMSQIRSRRWRIPAAWRQHGRQPLEEEAGRAVSLPANSGRWRRRRAAFSVCLVIAMGLGVMLGVVVPRAAEALPRGEWVAYPGGVVLANFVLPDGRRAYCVEAEMREPTGATALVGNVPLLPGRAGRFASWGDADGMRQMNYLISEYGQWHDAYTAAAVQLSVWRLRERLAAGNAYLNGILAKLAASAEGREVMAASDWLISDARAKARPPVAPKANTGKLAIRKDPSDRAGRYRVSYPAGTATVTLKNANFVSNHAATLEVTNREAGTVSVDRIAASQQVSVAGTWVSEGTRGWEPSLELHNSWTSAGEESQRLAVATGLSSRPQLRGVFAAVAMLELPPRVESLAQPAAEVGGTMRDTLRVLQANGSTATTIWPGAVASFTAYLLPEAGAGKYDTEWRPLLGETYEVQAEDQESGAPLWDEWWADAAGHALVDESGARIPMRDVDGALTTGIAAGGTAYPVQSLGSDGTPATQETGEPIYMTVRTPRMESRQDQQRWTQEELDAMTPAQRCIAQPVHTTSGLAITGVGEYRGPAVSVKSAGTVHWVEQVRDGAGNVKHSGVCGLAHETTQIGAPAVVTQAVASVGVGGEAFDTATVSGTLLAGAEYVLRFDAFAGNADSTGTTGAGALEAAEGDAEQDATAAETDAGRGNLHTPICNAENRIFRSEPVVVTEVGDYRSAGFPVTSQHGTTVWWVESFYLRTPDGLELLHRGTCGLANETTHVTLPEVETQAPETVAAGDLMSDTAMVTGEVHSTSDARWELTFAGYGGDGAQCEAEQLRFETEPIPVTAAGDYTSPPVVALAEWVGTVSWVETLWLVEAGERIPVHRGECGIANETSTVLVPEIVTEAQPVADVGSQMLDRAIVTGTLSQRAGVTHEVVFELYQGEASLTGTEDARCDAGNLLLRTAGVPIPQSPDERPTDPAESEAGVATVEVTSPEVLALPEYGGTVWWVESLLQREGETVRVLRKGSCGLEGETTRVEAPRVETESAGDIRVGERLFDTAVVSGNVPDTAGVEFRVSFQAFRRDPSGVMLCRPEDLLPELSDLAGTVVAGPGRYRSRAVTATEEDAGLGGFVETLEMIVHGEKHRVHIGECGEAGENFSITRVAKPMPTTGAFSYDPLLWGAAAALAAGGIVVSAGWLLRRSRQV